MASGLICFATNVNVKGESLGRWSSEEPDCVSHRKGQIKWSKIRDIEEKFVLRTTNEQCMHMFHIQHRHHHRSYIVHST